MIYYFTPYSADGLGHGYNDCCRIVPRDYDWIALMDADVMLFPNTFGTVCQEAINRHPEYAVFTCRTTRAHVKSAQQIDGTRETLSLVQLKRIADRQATLGARVTPLRGSVSGFFMLFPKWLWWQTPFPTEGPNGERNLGIDTRWIQDIRAKGHRVGMIEGVTAIHYYRMAEGLKYMEHLK